MRSRRLGAMAVVIVLATAGCGSDDPGSTNGPATAGAASPLAFTSPAIGGGTVDGAKFEGRPTLLWFWSPW